jgi:hypothetical protein
MRTPQTQTPCRLEWCWIGLLATSYQPGVTVFIFKFLAITAEVFGHLLAATVLAPTAPLIALPLAVHSVHVQSLPLHSHRGTHLPPHNPITPIHVPKKRDRKTRGCDSHEPPLWTRPTGIWPYSESKQSRRLDKTPRRHPRRHIASPVVIVIEGIAPSAPKG